MESDYIREKKETVTDSKGFENVRAFSYEYILTFIYSGSLLPIKHISINRNMKFLHAVGASRFEQKIACGRFST